MKQLHTYIIFDLQAQGDIACDKRSGFFRGSGCGSVGRAVASNSRDPRLEPRHQQYFIYKL